MKFFYKNISSYLFLGLILISINVSSAELKFITLEVAPWAHTDEKTGKYVGIFPDLIKEIEKRTGHEIKISLTPYARINRELEAGRQDCTMLIREQSRDDITTLGELVFYHPMGVIPINSIDLDKYDDLYDLRISVLRALIITDKFTNDNDLQKEQDTSYEMGLRKMKHGRLDAIAGAIPTIQYLAKQNGMSSLLGLPLQLSSEPIFLQCSNRSDNLEEIKGINEAIREIKDDSTLDSILNDYS